VENCAVELQGFIEVSPILRSGVYALAKDGVVVYVGQIKRMLSRIEVHRSQWGRKSAPAWLAGMARGILFDQIFISPCHPDRLAAHEAEMINRYKPRYNVKIKTPQPVATPFTIRVGAHTIPMNRCQPAFERRI